MAAVSWVLPILSTETTAKDCFFAAEVLMFQPFRNLFGYSISRRKKAMTMFALLAAFEFSMHLQHSSF